jgi:hypothetical protein
MVHSEAMKLYVTPAPSGGAAKLLFGVLEAEKPLIYASTSSTPALSGRLIVDSETSYYDAENPRIAGEYPVHNYYQVLDLDPTLRTGIVYYHQYNAATVTPTFVRTVSVDARLPTVEPVVNVTRNLIRSRLEYHLPRYIGSNKPLRPKSGKIEILELETLERDRNLPVILLKETITPTGDEAIGKMAGEETDSNGDKWLERRFRYQARIDLLALSENPKERGELADVIHECLLADFFLYEAAGYREVKIMRAMRSGRDEENKVKFAEEITITGFVDMSVRQKLTITVTDNQSTFVPIT